MDERKGPGSLQIYVVVFFAMALLFVIVAGVLQQRDIEREEHFGTIVEEQQGVIDLNTSKLENIQEQYESLIADYEALESENDSLQEQLIEVQSEMAELAQLLAVRDIFEDGNIELAHERLEGITTPSGDVALSYHNELAADIDEALLSMAEAETEGEAA